MFFKYAPRASNVTWKGAFQRTGNATVMLTVRISRMSWTVKNADPEWYTVATTNAWPRSTCATVLLIVLGPRTRGTAVSTRSIWTTPLRKPNINFSSAKWTEWWWRSRSAWSFPTRATKVGASLRRTLESINFSSSDLFSAGILVSSISSRFRARLLQQNDASTLT